MGPNASGKSALAIKIAKKLNGEIVSADSRQVYRGLDIGSGKVTKREMAGIPHHMLDVCSPRRTYTVADYKQQAEKIIDNILKRNKLPILVGGSGQYIDAITKGLIVPEVPPNTLLRHKLSKLTNDSTSSSLRQGYAGRARLRETGKLYQILLKLDSKRAQNIDKHNPRRLIRAIEVATALGKVPKIVTKLKYQPVVIGIKLPTAKLKERISVRLFARIRRGMIDEVKKLHAHGLSWKRLYDMGLEYRSVTEHLLGKISRSELKQKIFTGNFKYAKRQMTWFKRYLHITWLTVSQVNHPNPSLFLQIRSLLRANAPSNL